MAQTLDLANGAARDWSIEWLGLDRPASQIRGPDADRLDEPEVAAPADDKAAKVAGIVASCEDPEGTCVDTYLSARGITARPLPSSIRYRPNAHGRTARWSPSRPTPARCRGPADLPEQDGRKAPIQVPKRTNKARDDWAEHAAVRLPGSPPLILLRGRGDRAVAVAGDRPGDWACLGVANIGKAPVPRQGGR